MMTNQDPLGALRRLDDYELTIDMRRRVIDHAFGSHGHDPEKAKEMLALLSNEEERAIGERMTSTLANTTRGEIGRDPDAWMEAVATGTVSQRDRSQFSYAMRAWTPEQVRDAGERFEAASVEERDQLALVMAGEHHSRDIGPSSELAGAALRRLISR